MTESCAHVLSVPIVLPCACPQKWGWVNWLPLTTTWCRNKCDTSADLQDLSQLQNINSNKVRKNLDVNRQAVREEGRNLSFSSSNRCISLTLFALGHWQIPLSLHRQLYHQSILCSRNPKYHQWAKPRNGFRVR